MSADRVLVVSAGQMAALLDFYEALVRVDPDQRVMRIEAAPPPPELPVPDLSAISRRTAGHVEISMHKAREGWPTTRERRQGSRECVRRIKRGRS